MSRERWSTSIARPDSAEVKVGEVTDTSAIVWTRAPGRAELRCGGRTESAETHEAADFTHPFNLAGLSPATVYDYSVNGVRGRFETAPPPDRPAEITFVMTSCRQHAHLDHPDGFLIDEAMARLEPKFHVCAGDAVYYDRDEPRVRSVELARSHWRRMDGLPRHREFLRRVAGYWMKDDHDTYFNDCWPGMRAEEALPFTFEEGRRLFLEQVPMGGRTYRTFRWGRCLQIWLLEGRDFRSPGPMADGPEKTLWGSEQKRWLRESLAASDADWRIVLSPTPVVGPDKPVREDNHADGAYGHERREVLPWLAGQNLFVACGDRHWQYHSRDPETGVEEFGCGPASDAHAGTSPGEDPRVHRFHRVGGGFLSVAVTPRGIAVRHHDVAGRVVYEHARST